MSDHDPDPTRVERAVDETTVFSAQGAGVPPTAGIPPVFDDRTPPPPDRRPWIIAAVLGLIVLMLILLLVLQDDDGDDVDASSTTTSEQVTSTSSSSSSSSSSSTTTSTTAPAPTTTATPAVTVPPEECAEAGEGPAKPGLAAETLYDAWVRGDEACAAELTTPAALAELFSRDGTDASDEFQGCTEEDVPDAPVDCAFTYEGGSTHYLMSFSDTAGWQVYDITQTAD